jgi:hypothetical protein
VAPRPTFRDSRPRRQPIHSSAILRLTVSHLYEAIRANLSAFAERVGPKALFVGPEHGQIGADLG